jgi:CBS domain-containing protein
VTVDSASSDGQQGMGTPLRDLLRRPPLTCSPGTSLHDALVSMHAAKVGSIVIADERGAPLGILTERDVLRNAAAGVLDSSRPIRGYMTPSPRTLPSTADGAEAAVLMAAHGIRHVPVVEEGRLVGVVSERDLFALQRASVPGISDTIRDAADLSELKRAAEDIRALARNLIVQGMGAEHITRLVATLNDRLVCRILETEAGEHDLEGIALCWLALGSEGRLEQTLATDQDNGILFSGDLPAAEIRERLLPFARSVNRVLDECGFPLCPGNIMASNPKWCLSLEEWQEEFQEWIRNPHPEALLNSCIFFDFRGLWGETSLAERLRAWLNTHVKDSLRFQHAMTRAALESGPPPGFLGRLLGRIAGGALATVDLKVQGSRLFVDAARVYALVSGLESTNTATRLRISGERLGVPREEIEAMIAAFHFVLLFRLRRDGGPAARVDANRLSLGSLNEVDRHILVEAWRQASKLQSRLALDFQLRVSWWK